MSSKVHLHLAAARHVVDLLSHISVPAFTAIELVPLPIPIRVNGIAAIPAVDHILAPISVQFHIVAVAPIDDVIALVSHQRHIIAVSPVDDVIALAANQRRVSARPAVDDVVARSSEDEVSSAKTAYLVLSVLTGQIVMFVGAGEQAALRAAG